MWHRHGGNNQLWRNDNGVWRSQKDQSFVLDLKHDAGYGKHFHHHFDIVCRFVPAQIIECLKI